MTHEGQCLHTFEITRKRCLTCTGHNTKCPSYEASKEAKSNGEVNANELHKHAP